MRAEIITIGDEILIGQIVDTNSAWLGKTLQNSGIEVVQITSVRDSARAIKESFDAAFLRADILFVTGGLGPTKDDITKHTLAEYFSSPLIRDQATFDYLEKRLAEKGYEFNPLNQAQANVPQCCTVIHNANGTAPGMWFERSDKILISMPGVPFEMKAMVSDEVLPRLRKKFKLRSLLHRTLITFGIPESTLAIKLSNWEDNLPSHIKLAYLPNPRHIKLRLSIYDTNENSAREIEEQIEKLREIIPANLLGEEGASLESVVGEILTRQNETLSIAESCTGGYISSLFAAINGASAYYLGGVTSYSNDVKINVLGVNKNDITQHGAVSREVATAMAEGVRNITGSTYSIATTGIAGPTGGTPGKPVGTVWIAVATPCGTKTIVKQFGNLRDENIKRAAATAIDLLREELL